jgi:protein TonB
VEGDVVIEAVIDAEGNVVEAKVISGHALLLSAALDAVRQWKYEPTYLNGEPVPVRLRVSVTFELSR